MIANTIRAPATCLVEQAASGAALAAALGAASGAASGADLQY